MKTLLLALLLSLPAFADDGLIDVPDTAVVTPAPNVGTRYFDFGGADSTVPRSDNVDDYVNWMMPQIENLRKGAVAGRTLNHPYRDSNGKTVMCLPYHDAFGLKKNSDNNYEVNCLAGTKKEITHVLAFNMNVDFSSANCGAESVVRDFFNQPYNRNATKAQTFALAMSKGCGFNASVVDAANPFVSVKPVSAAFVSQELQKRPTLRANVTTSKARKTAPGTTRDTNDRAHKNPLTGL